MSKPKILLLYISDVSGHRQAALAIEMAIKILRPDAQTLSLNCFNYTNPVTEKIVNSLYMGIIKRTPGLWEYVYDNQYIIRSTQRIKEAIHRHNSPKLMKLLDAFKPDAVVCTQAFPCGMLADFKKTHNLKLPLVGVLTDYAPHSYWVYDTIDYYVVPSPEVKDRFVQKGVSPDRIKTYGIPIDPKFFQKHNQQELALKFGVDIDKPVILVMGGGQGLGPINKIVSSFKKSRVDSQLIVVAGTNQKLFSSLKSKTRNQKKKILVFKFITNIDELMEIATLIITKAGGLTTAEALSKGLPILIIKPLPGQEETNAAYLLNNGVAKKITMDTKISRVMQEVISNPAELRRMRDAALRISRPNASMDTARLLLGLCSTTSFTG